MEIHISMKWPTNILVITSNWPNLLQRLKHPNAQRIYSRDNNMLHKPNFKLYYYTVKIKSDSKHEVPRSIIHLIHTRHICLQPNLPISTNKSHHYCPYISHFLFHDEGWVFDVSIGMEVTSYNNYPFYCLFFSHFFFFF